MAEPVVRALLDDGARMPAYQSDGAAGADLCARLDAELRIAPGERFVVPTGVRLELPDGYEAQVRPRSGLALKHGVTCLNSPGTIDSDYRGKIGVILINHGSEDFIIHDGDRIAQLVVAPVCRAVFTLADGLSQSARHDGGFGSTGR